ncbi:MAG: hypothetical protein ACRYHQ_19510 [Janthinobacterium lividum]
MVATERKMGAKPLLDFSPGQQALTPLDAALPEGGQSPPSEEASPPGSSKPSSGQAAPTLKGVVVYLAPAEAIALKVYAAQHSTSIQQLGTEAFAELFKRLDINGGVLTRVRANRKNGANR